MNPGQIRPRLRIVFVYDALVPYCTGGAEQRFHALATRLAERHDVHYVTWRFWGPEPTTVRDGITLHGVGAPRDFYGTDGKRTIREALAFAVRVPAVLRRIRADVVDVSATPYLPLYAVWLTTRITGTPLVATWHEYWGEHWRTYLPDRTAVARVAAVAESAARPLADRRVAVSAFTARRMLTGGQARSTIDVVGNGVDLGRLSGAGTDDHISDVLFLGRLIDEKRVDILIRAIGLLAGRFPKLRCAVVGDGPERARLIQLASDLGVDRLVTFLGRVTDERIPALMRSSRIFVLPSVREGYGIAVVEAQACGLVPVVVRSPLSAASDLIDDGTDGLICDPTPESLAAALGALLEDPDRLAQLSRAARVSGSLRGWGDRAEDMERIYLDLTSSHRKLDRAGRRDVGHDRRSPRDAEGPGAIVDSTAEASA